MLKCEVNITMLTQGGFVYKTIFPEADRIYIYPRNYYGMVVVPVSYSNNTIIWTRYSISRPKKRESSPGGMTAGMPRGGERPPRDFCKSLILYGILTEQSIGKLFLAGIVPGLLSVLLYMATIRIQVGLNPKLGPAGPRTSFKEKLLSLRNTGGMLALFLLVMGGIYAGVFTPTEAGAVGACGAQASPGEEGTAVSNHRSRSVSSVLLGGGLHRSTEA
jgi:hypothetical protein